MRAAATFALFALTAQSTQAQFCFLKERKCLPGIGISVDYDEIPKLLGLPVTTSSTTLGTETQTASIASTAAASAPASVPQDDTSVPQDDPSVPQDDPSLPQGDPSVAARTTGTGLDFVEDLLKSDGLGPAASSILAPLAVSTSQAAASSSPAPEAVSTSQAAASSSVAPEAVSTSQAAASVAAPSPTPSASGGPVALYGQCGAGTKGTWTGSTTCKEGTCQALQDYYSCLPAAPAQAAAAPAAAPAAGSVAPPIVPEWIRELIPRGADEVPEAAEYIQSAASQALPHYAPDVTRPSAQHLQPLPAPGLNTESPRIPPGYSAPLLAVPNVESPRFNLTDSPPAPAYATGLPSQHNSASYVAETVDSYATPASKSFSVLVSSIAARPTVHFTAPVYVSETFSKSSTMAVSSAATRPTEYFTAPVYVSETHSSEMVDITTTITQTITITPAETVYLSKPTVHNSTLPKSLAHYNQTHAAVSTQLPTYHKTSDVALLTTTVNVWLPAPTSLSTATLASYKSVGKPVVSALYPAPVNGTSAYSTNHIASNPTATKPTVYVSPVPAYPSEKPEQYMGAATTNFLNVWLVLAAAATAMMAI